MALDRYLIDGGRETVLIVMGTDLQTENAGLLINFLKAHGVSRCRGPITLAPWALADKQLNTLFQSSLS